MGKEGDTTGVDFPVRALRPARARVATVLGAATLLAVSLFALRAVGGPSPSREPSPAPSTSAAGLPSAGPPSLDVATWVDFTSARNGISARFPPGWTVTPALGDSFYTRQGFPAPRIGHLHDPGPTAGAMDRAISPAGMAFFISSLWIPAGMTEAAWWAEYAGPDVCEGCTPGKVPGPSAVCFPKLPSGYIPVTVDGQPGYEHGGLLACPFFTEVVVLVGGRAYQLTASPNVEPVTSAVFDQALFGAWLSTIHFDPARADDTSRASPPPG